MNEVTLTIGQLAQRFGLNASAIRYYERVGVLPEPARESGQRRYGADAVKRLEALQAAKQAGFTLEEARLLLQRSEAGDPLHGPLRELAAAQVAGSRGAREPNRHPSRLVARRRGLHLRDPRRLRPVRPSRR